MLDESRRLAAEIARRQIRNISEESSSWSLRELLNRLKSVRQNELKDPYKIGRVLTEVLFPVSVDLLEPLAPLFEGLSQKHPEVVGLFVGGSVVHGGARVRFAIDPNHYPVEDLDIALLLSKDIPKGLQEIYEEANELLQSWASQHRDFLVSHHLSASNYEVCSSMFSLSWEVPDFNRLKNPAILSARKSDLREITEQLVANLQPSFPFELCVQRCEEIFLFLNWLYKLDPFFWKSFISSMALKYQHIHTLKHKHFMQSPNGARLNAKRITFDSMLESYPHKSRARFEAFLRESATSTSPDLARLYPSEFIALGEHLE